MNNEIKEEVAKEISTLDRRVKQKVETYKGDINPDSLKLQR